MSGTCVSPYLEALVSHRGAYMARTRSVHSSKSLMRNYTFYMGLDHSYIIATIFGLKNKFFGGKGGVAKMGKKGLKTCFFTLRPRSSKTSYLRRKNTAILLN